MIESKIYESKTCTRIFYRESEGTEIKDAFFETEEAADAFCKAVRKMGWKVSKNIWKWEVRVEI